MKLYFSAKPLRKMLSEATRWYNIGMEKEQRPYECIGYPLSFTKLKAQKNPYEVIGLEDIEHVIVTHMAIPQDEIKNYSPTHANLKKEGIDSDKASNDFYNLKIKPIIRRFPLLEIISRLHSHPFAKKAWHSGGDKRTIAKDEINARSQGYNLSFSFILTTKKPLEWDVSCFCIDDKGKETLQEVEFVSSKNTRVLEAKWPTFYNTDKGKAWEERFKTVAMQYDRYNCIREPRGWTSWWLMKPNEEMMLLVPPNFPSEKIAVYFSNDGKKWQIVDENYTKKWLDSLKI